MISVSDRPIHTAMKDVISHLRIQRWPLIHNAMCSSFCTPLRRRFLPVMVKRELRHPCLGRPLHQPAAVHLPPRDSTPIAKAATPPRLWFATPAKPAMSKKKATTELTATGDL
jgi:hypothetical protein